MSEFFLHERLAREGTTLERLSRCRITVCGAGALGANLCETLARTGAGALRVIDRDRIEPHNLSTQPYFKSDVGSFKARILANNLYRALGTKVESLPQELTAASSDKLLEGSELVLDTFDNSASRQLVSDWCRQREVPCLHAGLAAGFAEVLWNEVYRVPSPAAGPDDCNYPLARNLVMLAVGVAAEVVLSWLAGGERRNYTLTLDDLAVRPFC